MMKRFKKEEKRRELIRKFNSMSKEEQKEYSKTDEYQDLVKLSHNKQPSKDNINEDSDMQLIKLFSNKYFYNKGLSDGINQTIKILTDSLNKTEEELRSIVDKK